MEKILSLNDLSLLSISHLSKIKVRSQIIYISFLLSVTISLAALPFIEVDISVNSTGILQSSIETHDVVIPSTGRITQLFLTDNQMVKKGDALLSIDGELSKTRGRLLKDRILELTSMIKDITVASNAASEQTLNIRLRTSQYNTSWSRFLLELHSAEIKKDQARRELNRFEILFANKASSPAELEKYVMADKEARAAHKFIISEYRNQLAQDAERYHNELSQLYLKEAEGNEQKKSLTLKSPINGTIQTNSGITIGTNVFANQKVAQISPDSSIIGICYIKPSDIGLIKKGQKARITIDAFDYNQWGIINASVLDISDDVVMLSDRTPLFKVKCKVNAQYLQLKNGYKGHLKKGMTFGARFMVAQRSLFQLIYDKVDDWLNPQQNISN